jgi:hypothetical protein
LSRRRRGRAALAALALSLVCGCAGGPRIGVPVSDAGLSELADLLCSAGSDVQALQCSGAGSAHLERRDVSFDFAFIYDAPDWVRADVRPELGSMSGTMAMQLVWEGDCGRCYLPARVLEFTGCLSGEGLAMAGTNPVSLLVGAPQRRLVESLEDARIRRDDDRIILEGRRGDTTVHARFEGELHLLRELRMRNGLTELRLSYDGHGWKSQGWLPRTTEIRILRNGRRDFSAKLDFARAKQLEHIDRSRHTLEVPPEATSLSWEDLGIWRSE